MTPLEAYFDAVRGLLEGVAQAHAERYEEHIISEHRGNLRVRLRFVDQALLEISEALVFTAGEPQWLSYRYHYQDGSGNLLFRYDNAPHHPEVATHPDHKHAGDRVLASTHPSLDSVVEEVQVARRPAGSQEWQNRNIIGHPVYRVFGYPGRDTVICSVCNHPNEDHANFCDHCGQPLDVRCPACQSPTRAGARFCSQCGQSLSQPASVSSSTVSSTPPGCTPSLDDRLDRLQSYLPQHLADKILANRGRLQGERKLVTVLFLDIVGYFVLSKHLGEEALFAFMDDLYEQFIHDVHRYEGTVNELTGDGIVAFLGAPLAVEQAPLRAVRAALTLQQTASHCSTSIEQAHGLRLQIRVGINTGPVIVGTVGNNLRMDYKAVWDTVNLAARMEQTAEPGTIQITAQTYKLVEGYFHCEDLGLVSVKGAQDAVPVYRVLAERGVRTRIDVARERGFTRLVARQRELEQLRHCFELVQNGSGQAVSIIGDAGLGKSRLLYEFRQALASDQLTWLEGRCSPYNTAVAYLPIAEMLKENFALDPNDGDVDIRQKVEGGFSALGIDLETTPYLLHLLAPNAAGDMPVSMAPEAVKYRIFEALRLLTLEGAARRPMVLAVEDLHWVDKTTEEFLTFLLDHIAGARVLLVFTY